MHFQSKNTPVCAENRWLLHSILDFLQKLIDFSNTKLTFAENAWLLQKFIDFFRTSLTFAGNHCLLQNMIDFCWISVAFCLRYSLTFADTCVDFCRIYATFAESPWPLWEQRGVTLGPLWDHPVTICGPLWGPLWRPLCEYFGIMFRSLLDHFGTI